MFLFTPFILEGLPYVFKIGPEIYYLNRNRASGTTQEGRVDGIRASLERIKACGFYVGGDVLYGEGCISGHNRRKHSLVSNLADFIAEGRIGMTLMIPFARYQYIIPYCGYGYFMEKNRFVNPSPLCYQTKDTFKFIAAGFLSGLNFTSQFSMGINVKARFMIDGRSKVTDDPDLDDLSLLMNDTSHYRIEVPFAYTFCDRLWNFDLEVAPFYEYRHFGGREGFPFNFIDTKFNLFGARFAIGLRF
ncbi:MAG: hypothetical protein KDK55_04580 [Chlamydiia bacterium]|nr:hypothetical protein [Chlamydiia bacterium]